jgi:hypothetical protein
MPNTDPAADTGLPAKRKSLGDRFLDLCGPIEWACAAAVLAEQSFEAVFTERSSRVDPFGAAGVKLGEHRVYVLRDEDFIAFRHAVEHSAEISRGLMRDYDGREPSDEEGDANG